MYNTIQYKNEFYSAVIEGAEGAELSHKSTTRVILSSAASAAVAGGSWQIVYPTSGKGVPYKKILTE